jgi:predicted ribosome quality control (RQC) complex YloA/Tae2 family protein
MVFFFDFSKVKPESVDSDSFKKFLELANSSRFLVYMGKDKYENTELLQLAESEDLWFHVQHVSSAHVYLKYTGAARPSPSETSVVVTALAQLVKMNSIEGSKSDCVDVVYCKVSNLQSASGGEKSAGLVHIKNESACSFVKGVRSEKEAEKLFKKCKFEPHDGLQQLQRFKSDFIMENELKQRHSPRKSKHGRS